MAKIFKDLLSHKYRANITEKKLWTKNKSMKRQKGMAKTKTSCPPEVNKMNNLTDKNKGQWWYG